MRGRAGWIMVFTEMVISAVEDEENKKDDE